MKLEIIGDAAVPEGVEAEWAQENEAPDARVVARVDGRVAGHAALWWSDTPDLDGEKAGAVGGFHAVDEEAARAVLKESVRVLEERGCSMAIGPMNGNTWRRYRFVEEEWLKGRGRFFLEPWNDPQFPGWWRSAGFVEVSRYSSSVMELGGGEAVSPGLRARMMKGGLVIRGMDAGNYDDELKRIHALSLKSFAGNFLYTPLSESAFVGSYRKVKDYVDPDLVLLAERDGKLCGFVFGIVDLEEMKRGGRPALIVKTLAVDPEARSAGLGSLLVDELHRRGREKGFVEAIHALQHERNTSLKITGRHEGRVFRRYVLLGRKIGRR